MTDAADLARRLDRTEAESDVRRVVARYFQICDDLGPDAPLDELGALFTVDARWEGGGRYAEALGAYQGREAIVAMIGSYCASVPHFAMTTHFLSSEHIEVSGDAARARWSMLQCSTYHDGRADLRSAALDIGLARDAARWRIARFRSTNIFSRRVERWNDTAEIPVPKAGA